MSMMPLRRASMAFVLAVLGGGAAATAVCPPIAFCPPESASSHCWLFENATPSLSTAASPVVAFTSHGSKCVVHRECDQWTRCTTVQQTVAVADPTPTIGSLTFTPSPALAGENVQLVATVGGKSGGSQTWNVTGATTLTTPNPGIPSTLNTTGAADGTYEVTLTVNNGSGVAQLTSSLPIRVGFIRNWWAICDEPCTFERGEPVDFELELQNGVTPVWYEYDWNGDGTYDELSTVEITRHWFYQPATFRPRVRIFTAGTSPSVLVHDLDITIAAGPLAAEISRDGFEGGTSDWCTHAGGTTTCSAWPEAVDDVAVFTRNSGPHALDVLANDVDLDGAASVISAVTQPADGTVTITSDGSALSFEADSGYCNCATPPGVAADIFTYTLMPTGSVGTVTVWITCSDVVPTVDLNGSGPGTEFALTFTEGDAAKLLVDPTDATVDDVDSPLIESLTVTLADLFDPGHEVLTAQVAGTGINFQYSQGAITFTGPAPPATFRQVLRTLRYQNTDTAPDPTPRVVAMVANDGSSDSVPAIATVTILPVDDPPTAVDDTATVDQDATATTIPVLANDTDGDGGAIAITSTTQPANGAVVVTNDGADLTYAPIGGYCNSGEGGAPDTFTYTLAPGTSSATVSVTVTCTP